MEVNSFFIRCIRQKDRHQFTIEWTDGKIIDYRLSDIQRHCVCARCNEAKKMTEIDNDVEATRIVSVGNYALQIYFTKGCSKGIYPFWLLRKIGIYNEK